MENQQGFNDPAKTAATDAMVSESVTAADLGIAAAPVASASVPSTSAASPDMTAVMMEMMKTMQGMQKQLNELQGAKPVVVKATAKKATANTNKTKTSV
jgi:hypothetical protein